MDFSKYSVDKPFIGQKISFDDNAPKKWVDLYTLLYDHFACWCHRHDATLQQRSFSYSSKAWYPTGINFYITKRNSSDEKDRFKFSVCYDELTEQVTMRFFVENVNIVVGGHNIHESMYCEPIISVFMFDKPKDGVKSFDITNGDNDNKMEHDWRPLDVLKAYFGDKFWNNILEIFNKFIPKQTKPFYENILYGNIMKAWSSDPEYQFFEFIRDQFSKLAREWFQGSVMTIKSINAVDWDVVTFSSSRYRIILRHLIENKDSNGISDDNLTFFKIDPICGTKRIIPAGLDHEFGKGFQAHVELIFNRVRTKIKQFVDEEKRMNNDKKKEFDTIREAVARLTGTLTEVEPFIWTREEFEKITNDLKKLAESAIKEEKEMNSDVKKAVTEIETPKFPHFSTSKDGVKLVTLPFETYRTMVNTQYGMAVNIVKDRRTEIRNAYWNPKTGVATILWADGSKTMSKPMEGTTADPEIGFALCIAKKMMGGTQNKWRKWLKSTIDASADSTKKKSDKSRIKLEKQARARLLGEGIDNPDSMQLEAMIETIKAENTAASEKTKPTQEKLGRKKSTN